MKPLPTNYAAVRTLVAIATSLGAACAAPQTQASGHAPAAAGHGDHGDDHGGGHGEEASAIATGMFELGEFHLRNFRPTHNETASIRFSLHLVLDKEAKPEELAELQHWQRRLRDQAIVAVRSAEAADLAEPDLARVRRLILIRFNRLPVARLIKGVYLTNFAVGDG
jgi:hypothetical protein